jgi:hypothetical protein
MSNLATIVNNILADSGIDDINVVVTTGSYTNPAWITSLAWTKITGAPANIVTGTGLTNRVAKFDSNGSTITYGLILDNGSSIETNAYTYITKTLIPRQAVSYETNFNNAINSTAGWIYLGNLVIPQGGFDACITMQAGIGFNASISQMGYAKIHIRTSNGEPAGGFYFSAYSEHFGYNNVFSDIRITENISTNTLGIYVYVVQFVGTGYYKVEGSGIEYIPVETATASPSTYYQVPRQLTVNSYTVINDSLSVNGPLDAYASTFSGDVRVYRAATPTTGYLFFGSTGTNYLGYDGSAFLVNGNLNATSFIKTGGTSSQYLMADGSVSTLTNPVTGTGTTNFVPKFTGASTIGNSAITDDGTLVEINAREFRITRGTTDQFAFGVNVTSTFAFGSTNGRRTAIIYTSGAEDAGLQFGYDAVDKTGIIAGSASNTGAGIDFYTFNGSAWGNRLRLNKEGNLGLGVTPSAWDSTFKNLEIGGSGYSGSFYSQSNGDSSNGIVLNAYFNSGWKYTASSKAATQYEQNNGLHKWSVAPSGTAGNAISFTQAMTLGSNSGLSIGTPSAAPAQGLLVQGNVGIGVSPDVKLDVLGTSDTSDVVRIRKSSSGSRRGALGTQSGVGCLDLYNDSTELNIRLLAQGNSYFNGGNVGIGTDNPTAKLQVVGEYIRLVNSADSQNILLHADTSRVAVSAPNGNLAFDTANAERMRIFSDGNVSISNSPSNAGFKLDVNGTGRFSGSVQEMLYATSSITSGTVFRLSNTSTGGGDFRFYSTGSGNGEGAGRLVLNFNGSSALLNISGSTGAATFSSTIRSNQTNGLGIGDIAGYRRIQYDLANTRFGFLTDGNALANIEAAAATFSSSVTANDTISINTDVTMLRFGNLLRWGFQRPAADNRYVSFMRNMNATATPVWTVDGDNGNVGIGTASGYARLSIAQDISTTAEFGSFGQFTAQGLTNLNKLLSFGFNTATDVGFIQAMVNGVSYNNLLLNARGGNVLIGTTADAGFRLDVNGSLRAGGPITSSQGYTFPNGIINVTGGSPSWVNLGTISLAQGGQTAVITIEGGSGFNASEGQNASARIFIRTSNGSPNGSGWFFSATLTQTGFSDAFISDCIITQTNSTTFNVFVRGGSFLGNTYYKVEGSAFTWTASNSDFGATAPSGGLTLTKVFNVISPSTFASSLTAVGHITSRSYLSAHTQSNTEPYLFLVRNNGSNGVGVIRTLDGGALAFDNGATGAAQSTKLTILSSGAATFNGTLNVAAGTTDQFAFGVNSNSTFAFGGLNGRRAAIIAHNSIGDSGLQFGWDTTDKTGVIAGSANDTGAGIDFYTFNGSAWGNRMRVTKDGNVLIGTTTTPTPVSGVAFPLTVSSSAATRIRIDSTNASPNSGVGLYANGVQKFSFAMYGTDSDFTIYNDALLAPALTVKGTNSNVLIGTTTSTGAKLEINGDIRTGTLDTGYVSGFWKLGRAVIGTQPSETHQIIVEINGALFTIGAAAL